VQTGLQKRKKEKKKKKKSSQNIYQPGRQTHLVCLATQAPKRKING
jgi:hypothetical protein